MRSVSAFAKVGICTLIAGAIGAVLAAWWLPDWFPPAAGVEAHRQDTLYLWLLVVSSLIFAVVVGFLGYSMWKFRARPGDMSDGAPIHGHTGLEIIWTVIPIVIVLGFAVAATIVLNRNEDLKKGHMVVNVTGKQFAWSFTYPKRGHLHTGILALPAGRQVEFRLHAPPTDVIHSFKIPALRVGEDVVPGTPTTVVATPTRVGTYVIVCAELCGIGHSQMRNILVVMKPAELEPLAGPAEEARQGPAAGAVRRDDRRGRDVQVGRLQRLPHLQARRRHRHRRPRPRRPDRVGRQVRAGRDGRPVRARVDRRPG